ncbi:MAG: DegT/DnrJ/EryC1/StrS family aminotransferase [Candidatus Bathyarchaeia archaeon]
MLINTLLSSQPCFPEDSLKTVLSEIEATLRNGVLTGGPHLAGFEQAFAEYNHVKNAVGVNSGTASLEITLRHFGVKDKEVIVPTNTFISTPNAVIFAGGKPVLADMREDTLCIDPEEVKRKFSSKTAAVVVVHIAGLVCPQIDEIRQFCDENGLILLEDASHAHGAMINGKMAGTLGDAGCFSLYPTKVMTSCEGGMIISNNDGLAEAARCMRNCGQTLQKEVVMLGHNWRLSEVAAIVGKSQLSNLEGFVARRNEIARYYEKALGNVDGVSFFRVPPNIRHSYYKFPVKLANEIDRDKLALKMKEKGIETGSVYYPPCHLQPYYLENYSHKGEFPVAEAVLQKVLCLPMHVNLTQENLEYITDAFVSSLNEL